MTPAYRPARAARAKTPHAVLAEGLREEPLEGELLGTSTRDRWRRQRGQGDHLHGWGRIDAVLGEAVGTAQKEWPLGGDPERQRLPLGRMRIEQPVPAAAFQVDMPHHPGAHR